MYQVRTSQLSDRVAFEEEVKKHILRMRAHNFSKGTPRPVSHPLVEACIKRVQSKGKPDQYVADYQIVDDINGEVSLEDRKQLLVNKILDGETQARNAVLPRRKFRLLQIQYKAAIAVPEESRTLEEKMLVEKAKEYDKAIERITMIAAQAESDIEDLTEENINSYGIPKF